MSKVLNFNPSKHKKKKVEKKTIKLSTILESFLRV